MPHADPADRRAYMREWKRRNRGRHAQLTRLYDAARHANPRAERLGVRGRISTADVRAVLTDDARCVFCGTDERLTIDHVVALGAGGPNERSNLQPACHSCNASKFTAESPWCWARDFAACVDCGTTSRKHSARGRCNRCYLRMTKETSRG